jgi:hypothetical protein
MDRSGVVFFDELEVLVEGDAATVIGVDLVEVPLHHFFGNLNFEGFKGVLHQSCELHNVDQLILVSIILLLCAHSSLSEKVSKLFRKTITYYSKVICPSPF